MTVAVIGAGVAGAAAARRLRASGLGVVVFDKGRGPGGRTATRRRDDLAFDHGAPWAADPSGPRPHVPFTAMLNEAVHTGTAVRWQGPEGPTTVGLPGMSALVRGMLAEVDVRCGVEVDAVEREPEGWRLGAVRGEGAGGFSAVLVTVPAPQCATLLQGAHPGLAAVARDARMDPTWTLMLAAEGVADAMVGVGSDALGGEGIATLVNNGAKPGRDARTLVAHATPEWTRSRLEDEPERVCDDLAAVVRRRLALPQPVRATAHRWRYARVAAAAKEGPSFDPETGLGIAGDWTVGPTLADAHAGGIALADAVLAARG
ncbi:NAD(P)/FAD-dependent oxidoreductase [Acuticoccus sp.]|uniref:NAD(P)/FAD-dependent oxidoreductase n=1 Tax=Acuticoccus sp. TaxID=1904378 RepID=UPI003B521B0A